MDFSHNDPRNKNTVEFQINAIISDVTELETFLSSVKFRFSDKNHVYSQLEKILLDNVFVILRLLKTNLNDRDKFETGQSFVEFLNHFRVLKQIFNLFPQINRQSCVFGDTTGHMPSPFRQQGYSQSFYESRWGMYHSGSNDIEDIMFSCVGKFWSQFSDQQVTELKRAQTNIPNPKFISGGIKYD